MPDVIDRKECEHLIGAVATDLADTEPDPTLPAEWCDGWDSAVREHGEPLAEQLRSALAEIDRLSGLVERTDQARLQTIGHVARLEVDRLSDRDLERSIRYNNDHREWSLTYATMRAELEALRCGDLEAFLDGALSPERDAAFRVHLKTCEACQAESLSLMQIDAALSGMADIEHRRRAVFDAAVAWVRCKGYLGDIVAAVNALEEP